jgi:hypothetical protein
MMTEGAEIAKTTIAEVLSEFLVEQEQRLFGNGFSRYRQVVEPVGSRSISSSHFGQARRRIDPSCVGHGWNRLTCQQRLWPHAGDEPLFAEHAVFAAQAVEFRALIRGQPVLAPPLVAVGLRHPVA